MSDIAVLFVTFSDRSEAERVAEAVLDERLTACINILAPCRSFYRWNAEIARGEEVPALFKTTLGLVEPLRARIGELHSYDQPVIEAWPVAAGAAVSNWISTETG